jgi:hypothetical protein
VYEWVECGPCGIRRKEVSDDEEVGDSSPCPQVPIPGPESEKEVVMPIKNSVRFELNNPRDGDQKDAVHVAEKTQVVLEASVGSVKLLRRTLPNSNWEGSRKLCEAIGELRGLATRLTVPVKPMAGVDVGEKIEGPLGLNRAKEKPPWVIVGGQSIITKEVEGEGTIPSLGEGNLLEMSVSSASSPRRCRQRPRVCLTIAESPGYECASEKQPCGRKTGRLTREVCEELMAPIWAENHPELTECLRKGTWWKKRVEHRNGSGEVTLTPLLALPFENNQEEDGFIQNLKVPPPPMPLLFLPLMVGEILVRALLDSGASDSFVSHEVVLAL